MHMRSFQNSKCLKVFNSSFVVSVLFFPWWSQVLERALASEIPEGGSPCRGDFWFSLSFFLCNAFWAIGDGPKLVSGDQEELETEGAVAPAVQ